MVGLVDNRFVLWSSTRKQVVTVRETHVLNTPKNAPALVVFFRYWKNKKRAGPGTFEWGRAMALSQFCLGFASGG